MEELQKCHYELAITYENILELKTQLVILETRKDRLIEEHNRIIKDIQARLDEKEKTAND